MQQVLAFQTLETDAVPEKRTLRLVKPTRGEERANRLTLLEPDSGALLGVEMTCNAKPNEKFKFAAENLFPEVTVKTKERSREEGTFTCIEVEEIHRVEEA